jgi:hypothetical protein
VIPRSREILIALYRKYLEELKQFEEGTPYRSHMEKTIGNRLDILLSTEDIFEIEEKIRWGQVPLSFFPFIRYVMIDHTLIRTHKDILDDCALVGVPSYYNEYRSLFPFILSL